MTDGDDPVLNDEGVFQGAPGVKFYYRRWGPEASPPKAVVAMVHGPGDESGLYLQLIEGLVAGGFAVYGFDHQELRRAPGQPGYSVEWDERIEDIQGFVRMVGRQEPALPLFLAGEGTAGPMVLAHALRRPDGLAGVIAIAPETPSTEQHTLLARVSRTIMGVWPGFAGTIPDAPSPDEPLVRAALSDLEAAEGGELGVPHLIFRRAGSPPPDQGQVQPVPGQLVTELTAWLEQHLVSTGTAES